MVGVPAAIPVTIPVADPTDPWAGVLLVQTPPVVALDSVLVKPIHTLGVPVIEAGAVFTVTTPEVFVQPVDAAVKVMGAVPAETPVTTPLLEPIVATVVAPLDHVPDPAELVRVMLVLWQNGVLPEGSGGAAFTVATAFA